MALALLSTRYRVTVIHVGTNNNIQFDLSNIALVKKFIGGYYTVNGSMSVKIQKLQVYYNTETYYLTYSFTDITEEDLK